MVANTTAQIVSKSQGAHRTTEEYNYGAERKVTSANNGRVIVITGASSGISRATAHAFAKRQRPQRTLT